jgi:hypothetical protein
VALDEDSVPFARLKVSQYGIVPIDRRKVTVVAIETDAFKTWASVPFNVNRNPFQFAATNSAFESKSKFVGNSTQSYRRPIATLLQVLPSGNNYPDRTANRFERGLEVSLIE